MALEPFSNASSYVNYTVSLPVKLTGDAKEACDSNPVACLLVLTTLSQAGKLPVNGNFDNNTIEPFLLTDNELQKDEKIEEKSHETVQENLLMLRQPPMTMPPPMMMPPPFEIVPSFPNLPVNSLIDAEDTVRFPVMNIMNGMEPNILRNFETNVDPVARSGILEILSLLKELRAPAPAILPPEAPRPGIYSPQGIPPPVVPPAFGSLPLISPNTLPMVPPIVGAIPGPFPLPAPMQGPMPVPFGPFGSMFPAAPPPVIPPMPSMSQLHLPKIEIPAPILPVPGGMKSNGDLNVNAGVGVVPSIQANIIKYEKAPQLQYFKSR